MNTTMIPRDPRLNPKMRKRVAEMRAKWDGRVAQKHNIKVLLSFDELLDTLLEDCMTFALVADACGVSREAIRLIYKKYVAPLLPTKSDGRKRVKVCSVARRHQAIKALRPRGLAAEVAEEVHVRYPELEVRAQPVHRSALYASAQALFVDDRLVVIRASQKKARTGRSITGHFRFRLSRAWLEKANVVVVKVPTEPVSWFVFPVSELRGRSSGKRWSVYIPEHPCDYHPVMGTKQTDWIWQWKEAWHVLEGNS
jgi:hypothetical protein